MNKLFSTAALVMTVSLSLTACGADAPAKKLSADDFPSSSPTATAPSDPAVPSESPSTDPADPNPTISPEQNSNNAQGTGYSLTVPTAWEEATKELSGGSTAIDLAYLDRFTGESMNVVTIKAFFEELDSPEVKTQVRDELKSSGFTNIRFPGTTTLDGDEALITSAELPLGGQTFYSYQVFAIHNGANYVLTTGAFKENKAKAYAKPMVASWVWE